MDVRIVPEAGYACRVLATLGLLVMVVGGPGVREEPPRLECALATLPGPETMLRFTLHNKGDAAVAVLDWNTPLEGLLADIYVIRRDGGPPIRYRGPSIKRGDPEAGEYVTIAPGGSVSEDVDLGLAYDLGSPGRYEVELRLRLHDVAPPSAVPRPRDAQQPRTLACPVVTLRR
jgi:hypothetical protein